MTWPTCLIFPGKKALFDIRAWHCSDTSPFNKKLFQCLIVLLCIISLSKCSIRGCVSKWFFSRLQWIWENYVFFRPMLRQKRKCLFQKCNFSLLFLLLFFASNFVPKKSVIKNVINLIILITTYSINRSCITGENLPFLFAIREAKQFELINELKSPEAITLQIP